MSGKKETKRGERWYANRESVKESRRIDICKQMVRCGFGGSGVKRSLDKWWLLSWL